VAAEDLAAPGSVVERLHDAWQARRPVVIELSCDQAVLRTPEEFNGPVHSLDPAFELSRERLQFLVWANAYDTRGGDAVWWHGRKAIRRIRGAHEGGPADLLGPDDRPYFVDGGPPDPPELPTGVAVVHRFSAEAGVLTPSRHLGPKAELAPDQLAAVAHVAGGARVIAPAGSGKTRVLTERLRHLLANRGAHPSTVTAVAFNTRAAEEIRGRVQGLATRHGPQIRTLNSLGLWVCNELGEQGQLAVLDEAGSRQLVEEVFPVKRQANVDTVAPYLDALSAVRLGLASPQRVEEAMPDASGLAEGFEAYRGELRCRRMVDFDEQIYRAVEILVRDAGARSRAQSACRRILVDEFQDLAPAHLLLIRLLCAPGYDCFGVGDDDQVIYGYSGADPRFLIDFPMYFPGSGSHALEVNYRCPPAVVDAARHLLSYNGRRVAKVIRTPPQRQDPPPVLDGSLAGAGAVAAVAVAGEELGQTAKNIVAEWLEGGVSPEHVAVLARVNSVLLPVYVACVEAGIPVSATLGPAVLRRTGVRTALAYLRIAQHPDHIRRDDVRATIHRPSRKISKNVSEMVTKDSATSVRQIRRLAGRLSGGDVPKLRAYAADLERVAAAASTVDALRSVRLDLGLGAQMDVLDGSRKEADRATHADDLLAIEAVAALHPEPAGFEEWLTGHLSRPAASGPAVLLSTVHRIKGKEWPRVIVFGANRGLFPHRLGDDEEGERRVFHVALTRTLERAVVVYDRDAPSPFLAELDGSRPHTPLGTVAGATGPATGASRVASPPARSPTSPTPRGNRLRGADVVPAVLGLELEVGGHRGTVVELRPAGVVVRVGSLRMDVDYGTRVVVRGHPVSLVASDAPPNPSEMTALVPALKLWRSRTAKAERVPAYVILNDADLLGVAQRAPASLAELGQCRGIGPLRLERYGDEILAVVEEASSGTSSEGGSSRP
jgi:DNA helicase II / ATP-dependent DNA helicase PcrA